MHAWRQKQQQALILTTLERRRFGREEKLHPFKCRFLVGCHPPLGSRHIGTTYFIFLAIFGPII